METHSALLAFCAGNSQVTGEFTAQSQWRGALIFSLIYAWTNTWANNEDAGDLRRNCAHYDVIVINTHTPAVTEWANSSYKWNAGPCITNVTATCRKNFSQWESSFLWKLRCHWLKFLRRVAKTLVIQGPGLGTLGHVILHSIQCISKSNALLIILYGYVSWSN